MIAIRVLQSPEFSKIKNLYAEIYFFSPLLFLVLFFVFFGRVVSHNDPDGSYPDRNYNFFPFFSSVKKNTSSPFLQNPEEVGFPCYPLSQGNREESIRITSFAFVILSTFD